MNDLSGTKDSTLQNNSINLSFDQITSDGLRQLAFRGFLQQCTDLRNLDSHLAKRPVTLYAGFDPTGPSLHVGHMVPLFAMAHLARAGHKVIALVGGGTAQIGDPSGKTEMRQMLTVEKIQENALGIGNQIRNFFAAAGAPQDSVILVDNAQWLTKLNYIEFLRDIGKHFSVNRMLTFETYKQRLETGLSFIEFNYQLLQSYDYYILNRDYSALLQIGGDDQWGNIVAGIDLIRRLGGTESYGLTFPLITRADGKKMGKSEKGAIFLDSNLCSPYDLYQYWRNTPDQDVLRFLKLFTFLSPEELSAIEHQLTIDQDINKLKELLGYEYTKLIHGTLEADKALDSARSLFSGSTSQIDRSAVPSISISSQDLEQGISVLELFARTDLCASKADARRLVTQGGARINDQLVTSIDMMVTIEQLVDKELLLKAGKKRYFRVILE
jgi:tyrosyl-tRNA synthetase